MQGTSQSLEPEIKPTHTHTDTTKTDKIFIASYAMPNIPPKRYGAIVPRYRCRRTNTFLACSVGGGSGSGAISHRPIASSWMIAPSCTCCCSAASNKDALLCTDLDRTNIHTHTPAMTSFFAYFPVHAPRSASLLVNSLLLPRLALHFFNRFIATGSHLHTIKTANRLCFAQ